MPKPRCVRDFMLTRFVSFRPETPLDEACQTVVSKGLMGAPVVDAEGRLVGVLAEKDVFQVLANRVFGMGVAGGIVADRMTRSVVSIDADTDLATVCSLFLGHAHRGFPVVHQGKVVGLVSRREVLTLLHGLDCAPANDQYPDYRRPQT